jgi:hypothetical protein
LKEFLIFFEGNSGQKKEKIRKLPSSEMEALHNIGLPMVPYSVAKAKQSFGIKSGSK